MTSDEEREVEEEVWCSECTYSLVCGLCGVCHNCEELALERKLEKEKMSDAADRG